MENLIKEFNELRSEKNSNKPLRQAKELQSLQRQIKIRLEESNESNPQAAEIVAIKDEWWCND